jgi:feruloyl esterase
VAANQRPDGTAILLKDRLPLIHQAVLAHCPTLSGVQDGILQNPYACRSLSHGSAVLPMLRTVLPA